MVLVLEVPLAGIAFVLSLVSWKTLRAIKHLGVGKSFWIPILLSGTFFLAGSVVAILNDLGISFITHIVEVAAVSKLLALCALVSGVYTYSRKITKNLAEEFTLPSNAAAVAPDSEKLEVSESNPERVNERISAKEVECKYEFGYLQTLPRSAAIPDDCLNCHQIIECKHSYLRRAGRKPATPSSETISKVMISDADLEEETANER
jgi:hypothetical protein